MCGRYVLSIDADQLQLAFDLATLPADLTPRYNIAPTQPVPVISNEAPSRLSAYRWGLIPHWADDPAIGNRMINARSETLHEKPSFRAAYKRQRCLIPASGFYEWKQTADGNKQPVFIQVADQAVFAFAGLWESWKSPQGETVRSCTIITTQANDALRDLHHRMPVILHAEDYDLWLSSQEQTHETLGPLLRPYETDPIHYHPVSTAVNKPHNDDATLIQPVYPPDQPTLL
jgi:putative SOS response-associated peptidase YedK